MKQSKVRGGVYASGPLARLPRIPYASLHHQRCNPNAFPSGTSLTPEDHRPIDKNGRTVSAGYHQRRFPSSTALLQVLYVGKPRAPPRTSRILGPVHLASYTSNFSACLKHPVAPARAPQPRPTIPTLRRQIPLLRHTPRNLFHTSHGRTTNAHTLAPLVPHT